MRAFVGGRVLTPGQGVIEAGTVLVDGDRIVAVGATVAVPEGAEVVRCEGKWVTPGLIDAHSHLGVYGEPGVWANQDGNELTSPVTPHLRGIDSLNPNDPAIAVARAAGVTTVCTGPGGYSIVAGTAVAIKLAGRTVEEMVLPGTETMKMALGENPKKTYGEGKKQMPSTRMGSAAVLREALVTAQNYLTRMDAAGSGGASPERDLRWEALGRLLRGEIKARIHAHRADDILTAIRVAEEFGFECSLQHATEGYLIADILAAKGIACVVGPLLSEPSKMELTKITLANPGRLARAGVKVALMCDSSANTRWLPLHAGIAVREGMPEEDAWRAITINAAEILGVADRVGSLEAGKDADLVVWDGHPMHTMSRVERVLIGGRQVHPGGD